MVKTRAFDFPLCLKTSISAFMNNLEFIRVLNNEKLSFSSINRNSSQLVDPETLLYPHDLSTGLRNRMIRNFWPKTFTLNKQFVIASTPSGNYYKNNNHSKIALFFWKGKQRPRSLPKEFSTT